MAITPGPGYKIDPNNPNAVVPIDAPTQPVARTLSEIQNTAANQGQPGYDALGGPVASTTQNPINRTITTATADPAETFLSTFTPPETRDQIIERKRKESQGLIDSINRGYDDEVAAKRKIGQERIAQTDAVSVLSGLMGSTEATHSRQVTTDANQKEIDAVNNKRALDLAKVYGDINKDAETEAHQQLEDATRSAEQIVARRKEAQTKAIENIKLMASGGLVDFEAFKNDPRNKQAYDYALQSVGGSEDTLRAMFAINRPQDQLVGSPVRVGDHFVQAYQNPITGKVSYENIKLPFDLPTEYKTFQKMGDNLVAIPDNWDGDVTKLRTIAGQPSSEDQLRLEGLRLDNAKKRRDLEAPTDPSDQLYAGLSKETSTAVRSRVSKFGTEPVIQNFSTIQEGRNFVKSLSTDTKNPADDQALIYALAKALDPGSVVREGEYKTAQNYAQSWVNAYGKGITQALAGTGFLSQAARDNIKKVIEQRYQASKQSYDNIYKQYEGGINSLTGRTDGAKFLTDYAIQPSSNSNIDQLAQQKGFDVESARAAGYSDEEIQAYLEGN